MASNDLDEEPLANLPPLADLLMHIPLVHLEEAVEPLQTFVHDIKQMAATSKEESSLSSDGLTRDESASIHLLTMHADNTASVHKLLNQAVRARNRRTLEPWFSYLKLLITALKKLPDYRGAIYCHASKSTLINEYTRGRKIVWWGFNFCKTSIPSVVDENSANTNGPHLLFMIECCNGKNISHHSYVREKDDQILLLPDSRFEIWGHMHSEQRFRVLHLIQEDDRSMSKVQEKQRFRRSPESAEMAVAECMTFSRRPICYRGASNQTELFARPFDEFLDDREDADQSKYKPKSKPNRK